MASKGAEEQANAQYRSQKAYVDAQRAHNEAFFKLNKQRTIKGLTRTFGALQLRSQQEEGLLAQSLIEQNDEATAAISDYTTTGGESGAMTGINVIQSYYALKARQVAYAERARFQTRANAALQAEVARDQAEASILSAFPPPIMDPTKPVSNPFGNLLGMLNAGIGGATSGIAINDALGN
jgi:hypothetical protein